VEVELQVRKVLSNVRPIAWIAPAPSSKVKIELKDAVLTGANTVSKWEYPEFDQTAIDLQLTETQAALHSAPVSLITKYIHLELEEARESVAVIASRNDDRFVEWATRKHGRPSPNSLVSARSAVLDNGISTPPAAEELDSRALAEMLQAALRVNGLQDWIVRVSETQIAAVSVRSLDRIVSVRSDANFTTFDAARLMVHEVGTHAFRAANAHGQPEPYAVLGLQNSTSTEEGLAAWHEAQLGVSSRTVTHRYAARLIGAELARESGIVDLTHALAELVGIDDAVAIAIRAKRGLTDPNRIGGFGKDQAYFCGLEKVQAHLTSHPEDYVLLMATKWPLEMLEQARELFANRRLSSESLLFPSVSLIKGFNR
jgi:hypothetical protein